MSTLNDEYRWQAEYCRRMADLAPVPMKSDWLRLAQDWLAMVRTDKMPANTSARDARAVVSDITGGTTERRAS